MRTRRPAQFDPVLWELLGHAGRLEVMSLHARDPQRAAALRQAAAQHTAQQLDRVVRQLEQVLSKQTRSAHDY